MSGKIYEVEEDEIKNLDDYQIPLNSKPKPNCKCYGRGYKLYNRTQQYYQPCPQCIRKKVFDLDKMKRDVETKKFKEEIHQGAEEAKKEIEILQHTNEDKSS